MPVRLNSKEALVAHASPHGPQSNLISISTAWKEACLFSFPKYYPKLPGMGSLLEK